MPTLKAGSFDPQVDMERRTTYCYPRPSRPIVDCHLVDRTFKFGGGVKCKAINIYPANENGFL